MARVFRISGGEYEIPSLDTFTMDESEVFFRLTNVAPEEIWIEHLTGEDEKVADAIRSPQFLRALMEVAYRRGNPGEDLETVHGIVGQVAYIDALNDLVAQDSEDDAVLPTSTTEPPQSSENEKNESESSSSSDSGSGSTNGSVVPEGQVVPIGASR